MRGEREEATKTRNKMSISRNELYWMHYAIHLPASAVCVARFDGIHSVFRAIGEPSGLCRIGCGDRKMCYVSLRLPINQMKQQFRIECHRRNTCKCQPGRRLRSRSARHNIVRSAGAAPSRGAHNKQRAGNQIGR